MTNRDKLREYIKHTPTNSNPNVVESFVEDILRDEGGNRDYRLVREFPIPPEESRIYYKEVIDDFDWLILFKEDLLDPNNGRVMAQKNQFYSILDFMFQTEGINNGIRRAYPNQEIAKQQLLLDPDFVFEKHYNSEDAVAYLRFYEDLEPKIYFVRCSRYNTNELHWFFRDMKIKQTTQDMGPLFESLVSYPFDSSLKTINEKDTSLGGGIYFYEHYSYGLGLTGKYNQDVFHFDNQKSKWELNGINSTYLFYEQIIKKTITSLDSTHLKLLSSPNFPDGIVLPSFVGCKQLQSVNLTNLSEYNGFIHCLSQSFQECNSLKEIKVLNPIEIDSWTFNIDEALTKAYFPYLRGQACEMHLFGYCHNLTEVMLPKQLIAIATNAFIDCEKLSRVYYMGQPSDYLNLTIESGNTFFINATKYYYSEVQPTDTSVKYWHFAENGIDPIEW